MLFMVRKNYTVVMKKNIILSFLKEKAILDFHKETSVESSPYFVLNLTRAYKRYRKYPRRKVYDAFYRLEKEGYVYHKEKKSNRGSLPMKLWFLKDIKNVEIKIDNQ